MGLLGISPAITSTVLVALPKIIQSVFAAASDFYTWKLAEKLYGVNSNQSWAAVSSYHFSCLFAFSVLMKNIVLGLGLQPLAVVLLDPDFLQFGRDNPDHCSSLLLAVGDSRRLKGEQASITAAKEQCHRPTRLSGSGCHRSVAPSHQRPYMAGHRDTHTHPLHS